MPNIPVPKITADLIPRAFARFTSWDADGDGHLARGELDRAMGDPRIRGRDAAALAALRIWEDEIEDLSNDEWGPENDGMTKRDLAVLELRRARGDARDVETAYQRGVEKIVAALAANPALLGSSPFAIEQGYQPDCGFVAGAVGLAWSKPVQARSMVTRRSDGQFEVRFPGRAALIVKAPTDAEIAIGASSVGSGSPWILVLEKAFGMVMNQRASSPAALALDAAGGRPLALVIGVLTGHGSDTDAPGDTEPATTRAKLKDALRERRLVLACTGEEVKAEGLVETHAYTVIGFDARSDTVTLRNPWGQREPGNDKLDDGLFRMSLAELSKHFVQICYEEAR